MKYTFFFVFLLLSVFLVAQDLEYQQELLSQYSHSNDFEAQHEQVIGFLLGAGTLPEMTVEEASHLEDVKKLLGVLAWVLLLLLVLGGVHLYLGRESKFGVPLTIMLIIIIFTFLFPHHLFTLFHEVFFPQGNYLFPTDSFLITLYPAVFFGNLAERVFVYLLFFVLASIFVRS